MKALFVVGAVLVLAAFCGAGVRAELSTTGVPIVDLGPGMAEDINNLNQVVGTLRTDDGGHHAFLWSGGRMQDIGALGIISSAYSINNSGQIVGGSTDATGNNMQAFLRDPDGAVALLGKLRDSDTWSFATGINIQGQVVGWSGSCAWDFSADQFRPNPAGDFHAFLWDGERKMQELTNMPAGYPSVAYGINDDGQVVGQMGPYGVHRAFCWNPDGALQDLGLLPGSQGGWSGASDINNDGQVVGTSSYGSSSAAFLWDTSGGMRLVHQNGWDESGLGINNLGHVVGGTFGATAYYSTGHGDMSILGGLLGDAGHYGTYAHKINDGDFVVGHGARDGYRAVLWGPVPEPSGLLALASGLLGLGGVFFRRRRR